MTPSEFNEHQRDVFCVFSGSGVDRLRKYLNTDMRHPDPMGVYDGEGSVNMFDDDNDTTHTDAHTVGTTAGVAIPPPPPTALLHSHAHNGQGLGGPVVLGPDDDDDGEGEGFGDESEMIGD